MKLNFMQGNKNFKQFIILAVLFISSVFSNEYSKESTHDLSNFDSRYNSILSQFEDIPENYIAKTSLFSSQPIKKSLSFLADENSDSCNSRNNATSADYYYLLPTLKSKIHQFNQTASFEGGCFKNNHIHLEKISKEETIIDIFASNPKSFFCKDSYIVSLSNFHTIKFVFSHGNHKIILKNLTDEDVRDIQVNGVRLFAFCQGFFTSAHSLLMTLKLYLGGFGNNPNAVIPPLRPSVPEYMEKANVDFLERFVDNKLNKRRKEYGDFILNFNETEIQTGDFVAIYRLDGLDPLIMLGTGSHIGHSAVACWIDGELYVLESQDGWYWPKRGIQRNKWKTWLEWAHNADFNVAILPLKEEYRQKLNVDKSIKFFESVEGVPYGYHNFLFSWIDTPDKNLPPLIDHESVILVFSILEKISRSTVDTILGEALNMRMGTRNKTIHEIAYIAAGRNMTIESVLAIPELEGWEYSTGPNYVCSCFVIAFYKHGDMLEGMEIEPNEFTPKDVYQLSIYDREYKNKRPQICKDADPELEYCQVIGKYQVTLPGYSSISPYPHMNERCPSQAPHFIRPDGC